LCCQVIQLTQEVMNHDIIKSTALTININGKEVTGKLDLLRDYDRGTEHLNPLPEWLDGQTMGCYYFYEDRNFQNQSKEYLYDALIEQITKRCKASLEYSYKWIQFLKENFCKSSFNNEDTIKFSYDGSKDHYGRLMHKGQLYIDFEDNDEHDICCSILQKFDHKIPMIGIEYCHQFAKITKFPNTYTQCVLMYIGEIDNPEKDKIITHMEGIAESFCTWQQGNIHYIKPKFYTTGSPYISIDIHTVNCDPEIWDNNEDEVDIEAFNNECIEYLIAAGWGAKVVPEVLETA